MCDVEYYYPEMLMNQEKVFLWVQGDLMMKFADS